MCKVELKVQEQFIAGILIKNRIPEISVEDKDKLLKDSYANELLSNGLLKIEDIVEEYEIRSYMDEGQYVKNGKALRVNYDNLHAYHIAFGQEIYNELTNKIDKLEKQLTVLKSSMK